MRVSAPVVQGRHGPLIRALVLCLIAMLTAQLPVEAGRASVIYDGPRSSGGVALTFDDGWGVGSCARIAATLRRERVTATFFISFLRSDSRF